jgi:hypothetical protein
LGAEVVVAVDIVPSSHSLLHITTAATMYCYFYVATLFVIGVTAHSDTTGQWSSNFINTGYDKELRIWSRAMVIHLHWVRNEATSSLQDVSAEINHRIGESFQSCREGGLAQGSLEGATV